jgi:hypothetical protein
MRILALGLLTLIAACASPAQAPPEPADLVVRNGRIVTVDGAFTVAQAFAVREDRFVYVGTDEGVRRYIGPSTRVLDAGGRSVLPGLIDTHVHALGVATQEAAEPFATLSSIAEVQDWVRRKAVSVPEGEWIRIPRSYPTRLREKRFPTREELDAAAPRHPVVFDGAYAQVVNSEGLRLLGITRDTPSPEGGEIVKDSRGEPTGLLRNLRSLIFRRLSARLVPEEEILRRLEEVHLKYLEVGITSVAERAASLEGYRRYLRLKEEGRLRVRAEVTILLDSGGTAEGAERFIRSLPLRPREGDDRLRVGPLKITVDGGILIGTAYMREPYGPGAARLYAVTDPTYRGTLTLSPAQVRDLIRAGHRLGWPMSAHVTGDAGVDLVLDAVEAAAAEAPFRGRPFTLIHAYFPDAATVRRAARLGVRVDTQPAWLYKDGDALREALGEERMARFLGLRAWLDGGVTVAINTDHMFGMDPDGAMNPFNPFLTMDVAIRRKTEGGRVIAPEQGVTRPEALRMMTIDAARLLGEEDRRGSIEPGKLADFVILSGDFLGCPPERLRELRAALTVVGGRVAFER